jgi:molybdenum cofactor cytidylyltransferase
VQNIAAIVLAAGASTRLGQPKQLIEFKGETLIRRAANAVIDAGCDPVLVVTGCESERVVRELDGTAAHPIHNPHWPSGIGSSLRAGIAALQSSHPQIEAVVIVVCDQPYMNADIIRLLIDTWHRGGKSIAACSYAGTLGTPCCFGYGKFLDLSTIPDNCGAKLVLTASPNDVTTIQWPQGSIDLDRPEDLFPANLEKFPAKALYF